MNRAAETRKKRQMDEGNQLERIFDGYVRSWGPVKWRHIEGWRPATTQLELGPMVLALGLIESDSLVMRRKLAASRADSRPALLDFVTVWLAEEAEHGRALKALGHAYGCDRLHYQPRSVKRDLRAASTWPALYVAGLLTSLSATYCTLGAIQELIALTTYKHLAISVDEVAAQLLLDIARQEARHMRFYRKSAEILLANSITAQKVTRVLLNHLWRPPGMDLLGPKIYCSIFETILKDDVYCKALMSVDDVLSRLPGLEGMEVMRPFLTRNRYWPAPQPSVASALQETV